MEMLYDDCSMVCARVCARAHSDAFAFHKPCLFVHLAPPRPANMMPTVPARRFWPVWVSCRLLDESVPALVHNRLSASKDKCLTRWSMSGERMQDYEGHEMAIAGMALSPGL